ncbi:4-phosphopantetheinyl transferase [Microbacterium sp. CH12i]|uniref:4'-phosphopantetheinyl transferase family protein n=1 Tax=Microbacterium sp. CH12i TaxID=1479651 RepID=UPI000460EE67|nr:hypothetical protein [Microbacterium sp. CH12i]KDA05012.1 4-phosphopantetheinyl transferase [Microbacterium sp. CH12i]
MDVGRATVGVVRLAWADARTAPATADEVLRTLTAAQHQRYASLPPARAARFIAGRSLIASLVHEIVGRPEPMYEIFTLCAHCGSADHGKPHTTAPVVISVSYVGDMVVAAAVASDHATSIGVDIEAVPAGGESAPREELTALFTPSAPPDTRTWTMIEAALKADGRGLRVSPERLQFAAPETANPGWLSVHIDGTDAGIIATPAPAPTGFVVSLALSPVASRR